ncbi:MAG: alpha/beta hydrolase [Acidobacteriota bacterium]|nr:alpha/beta hydrolase [Acidobacteriota bacterium]
MSAAEPLTIHLWPNGAPGSVGASGLEKTSPGGPVGGAPIIKLANVSDPTLTVYRVSTAAASHAAVLVFPGGGYSILAYDLEGTEVCEWLNRQGITAVLVKYRVPQPKGVPPYRAPLQDAQRALGIVRQHAKEWNIDPHRIGVLGFSAGGHLAAALSTNFETRTYPAMDASDSISCRPDFAVLIYPAYLTKPEGSDKLAPELTVSPRTPPTFLVQAEDDPVHVQNSLFYYLALTNNHVPSEMHLFSSGGHGYGLRQTGAPVNRWPQDLSIWLTHLPV